MYFFDTYALYQIAKGIDSYALFTKHIKISTTLLNLYEFYYILCKEDNESLANSFFDRLLPCCVEIFPEDIKEAAKFRLKNSKAGLSYIDSLGYIIALRKGLFFLTGDDAFLNMQQVRFVK